MERNDVLIDKVMAYIREHPKEWDQRSWAETNACGTTACFAGHAMLLSGYKIVNEARGCDPGLREHDCRDYYCHSTITKFVRPDGTAVLPELEGFEGAKLLGMKRDTTERIFYATRIDDIDDMQKIIDDIRAEG